ncbi:MAG TPA: hypothetical protein VG474_05685 [Solirubrobacteraceae bacterium]|nr:hypothetical protein [Solirubrobacteraceae bacterium]
MIDLELRRRELAADVRRCCAPRSQWIVRERCARNRGMPAPPGKDADPKECVSISRIEDAAWR